MQEIPEWVAEGKVTSYAVRIDLLRGSEESGDTSLSELQEGGGVGGGGGGGAA